MLTREQAIAELTAPGAPCEVRTETVNAPPLRVFTRVHPTLRDLWLASVSARGDATYFVYDDVPLTYGEAHQQVVSLAAWLAERGIGKGDRVAIGMRNYPEWAVAFWAVECVGAVVVSLNAWWITEELEYALNDSGAIAAIVDGERSERLPAAMLARTSVQNLVTTRCQSRPDATPWEDATGNHSATLPRVEIAPDDDATILYTSGTTGFPKGAVGSHRNYMTNVGNAILAAAVAMKIAGAAAGAPSAAPTAPAVTAPKPQVRALATFPFFHIAGLCGLINNTNNGVCVHTMFKWDAGEALALIERHRVNVVGVRRPHLLVACALREPCTDCIDHHQDALLGPCRLEILRCQTSHGRRVEAVQRRRNDAREPLGLLVVGEHAREHEPEDQRDPRDHRPSLAERDDLAHIHRLEQHPSRPKHGCHHRQGLHQKPELVGHCLIPLVSWLARRGPDPRVTPVGSHPFLH
ncbi:MAG: AMP-binding protein [Actinomycetota bacterium]